MHTHFNGPLSGTTQVSQYQKGKTNLDFIEARDIEWQWHQLGCMQVCTSLQTDNHASTPPDYSVFYPSCHPSNSVKALKAHFSTKSLANTKNRCYSYITGSVIQFQIQLCFALPGNMLT